MSDLLALIRGGDPTPSTYIPQRSSKLPRPPRIPGTEQPVEPRKKSFFRSITSKVSNSKNNVQTPPQSPPPNPPWVIAINASATSLPNTNYTDGASIRYVDGVQTERRGSMQLPGLHGGYSSSSTQLSRLTSAHIDRSLDGGLRVPISSNENSRRLTTLADNSRRPSVSSLSSHTTAPITNPNGARQEYVPSSSNSPAPHSWDGSVLTIPTPARIMPSASGSSSSSVSISGGHPEDLLVREDTPPPAYSQRSSLSLGLSAIVKAKAKQATFFPPSTLPVQNNTPASDSQKRGEDARKEEGHARSASINEAPILARSPYPTAEQKAAAIAAVESRRKTHTGSLQPPIPLVPLNSFLEL